MNILSPLFPCAATRITAPVLTLQKSGRCRDFEMQYMECLEAYGVDHGRKKCIDYADDVKECMMADKVMKRFQAMRWERRKQYYRGEREQVFTERSEGSYF